jgi:hypothetical protein
MLLKIQARKGNKRKRGIERQTHRGEKSKK